MEYSGIEEKKNKNKKYIFSFFCYIMFKENSNNLFLVNLLGNVFQNKNNVIINNRV